MSASRSRRTHAPRGFTLIEILVVITIIGLLMSFSGFAAFQALRFVREKAVIAEIGRLASALEAYKEQRNGYPPCMAGVQFAAAGQPALPKNSFYLTRQQLLNAHTQTGYNGFALTSGPITSKTAATLKTYSSSTGIYVYQYYNMTPNNGLVKLDMDTMDPSEALVFWLGGFPTPYINGAYLAPKKLVGFSKISTNPYTLTFSTSQITFTTDHFLDTRTLPMFDFDEARLYDADSDGWYEYYPEKPDFNSVPPTAPYVYFDAATYTHWRLDVATQMSPFTGFPAAAGILPDVNGAMAQFVGSWGIAMPYAKSVNGTTITWINPQSYQIIAPGYDRAYSSPTQAFGNAATGAAINLSPATMVPRVLQEMTITDEERDNFTNFSDQKLADEASYRATTAAGS